MSKRCPECRYRMEHDGVVDNDDVYYCDVCGIYQSYPLEEALLAAEGKNCGCGKDPCMTYGAEDKKNKIYPATPFNCAICDSDRAYRIVGDARYCNDCFGAETFEARDDSWCSNHGWIHTARAGDIIPCTSCNDMICGGCRCGGCGNCENSDCCECKKAETFNSYKVAPELSSYTVDELVASKAGPQGSASYDEMVYDPIAQNRLSAESVSIPQTLLLIGAIVGGLGLGFFLTKNLNPSTPETSDQGGA